MSHPQLVLFVGVALLSASSAPSSAQSSTFRVDAPLPLLRLPEIGRERTIDLREFRGRKLVLFEFASW